MTEDELKSFLEGMEQRSIAAHEETRRHTDRLISETRQHAENLASDGRRHTEQLIAETRQHAENLASDGRRHTEQLIAETRQHAENLASETRRHFDVTAEGLRHEIRLVTEGVLKVEEKLEREVNRLDDRMSRGFADTQAMIKFSHAELDRRVRTLEESVSDLQARVERLETTTH